MHSSSEVFSSASRWLIAIAVLFATLSCQPETDDQVTEERAQAIASQYLEARNTANLDLLDDIYAPEVVVHDCSAPEDIRGLEALKSFYEASHAGFPDFQAHIGDVLVVGNQIVYKWTIEATHAGTLRGIPPTGKQVSFSGVAIDRLEGDRVVEEWVYFNVLDLLQQLGFSLVPPAAETPAG